MQGWLQNNDVFMYTYRINTITSIKNYNEHTLPISQYSWEVECRGFDSPFPLNDNSLVRKELGSFF
jgi:hypothetical protein